MKLASKFKTATVLGAVCAAFAVPAHAESKRSGLDAYSADAGVSPYFRLIGDYRISEKFSVYAEGTVRSLSKEIKDSPMVDGDIAYGFGAGVSYHF